MNTVNRVLEYIGDEAEFVAGYDNVLMGLLAEDLEENLELSTEEVDTVINVLLEGGV